MKFKREISSLTVDALVFSFHRQRMSILLIERRNPPFQGFWALPGGFVDPGERVEDAVSRELQEETGLKDIYFHNLGCFSDPDRDPRGRTISVAFWGIITKQPQINAGSDASKAKWFSINRLPNLAFDHKIIIDQALKNLLEIISPMVKMHSYLPDLYLSEICKLSDQIVYLLDSFQEPLPPQSTSVI